MSEPTRRRLIAAGALSGLVAVGMGAFGAHALRDRLAPDMLGAFETGARYHLVHAVAIVLAATLAPALRGAGTAAALLLLGVTVFSGSLYLLALTGVAGFGIVTPFGGVLLLAGWFTLAIGALRR